MPHQARYKCILVICQLPFNHKGCPSQTIIHCAWSTCPPTFHQWITSTLALQWFTIPKHYPQVGTSPKRTSTKEFQQVVLDATRSEDICATTSNSISKATRTQFQIDPLPTIGWPIDDWIGDLCEQRFSHIKVIFINIPIFGCRLALLCHFKRHIASSFFLKVTHQGTNIKKVSMRD